MSGVSTQTDQLRVLGIAGSLRAGSLNRRLLTAAAGAAGEHQPGLKIEPSDLAGIPLFNADVEAQGDPDPVATFKQSISQADALLLVTPEYQHGLPGVFKNALDWASRGSVLQGKVAAVMGASPGMTGTARAQTQLRQTLVYNRVHVVPGPEVLVPRAHDKLTEDGRLEDETGMGLMLTLLENLETLARALR